MTVTEMLSDKNFKKAVEELQSFLNKTSQYNFIRELSVEQLCMIVDSSAICKFTHTANCEKVSQSKRHLYSYNISDWSGLY